METYTWEVLPKELKRLDVTEQTLARFGADLGQLREEVRRRASEVQPMGEGGR